MRLLYLLVFNLSFFTGAHVFAAACCGGGLAAPSLIVGDNKAQLTTTYDYSQITDDVGTDSLWQKRSRAEFTETISLEAAHIFRDRWQAGVSIPVIRRTRAGEAASGLGDISTTLGYEFLPDWDYNPWRPRGLGFIQLALPTGRSSSESEDNYNLDSRGRGFWAIGAGVVLTKIIGRWDVYSTADIHRSFDKSYSNSQSSGVLKPGVGGNLGLGAGYNLSSIRIGAGLTWTYEDPIDVTGTTSSKGSLQRYATATASASYLLPQEMTLTLTYKNQRLFGSPVNTTLSQGAAIFLQKRWLR